MPKLRFGLSLFLNLLCASSLVAAKTSDNSTSPFNKDFSRNVFTDLGPIIALFGEKFAFQFLSEAFTIWDCIIFSMAPLGIISAIVAAIRVAGPLWMRAFVGRARENRASVELEVMSSTSRDVGEFWNGESIVRGVGRPDITQLIFIDSERDDPITCGLYTLQEAYRKGKIECYDYNGPSWSGKSLPETISTSKTKTATVEATSSGQADTENGLPLNSTFGNQPPDQIPDVEFENAPNISLNVYPGTSLKLLVTFALIGGILQTGVVAYSAAVTFHPWFRKRIPPYDEKRPHLAEEGFIILTVGTVVLTLALAILCIIIEKSTDEKQWIVKGQKSKKIRVIWLQTKQFAGDQHFDAAVLLTKEDKDVVLTSWRSKRLRQRIEEDQKSVTSEHKDPSVWRNVCRDETEWFTVIGTLCALAGFILQFQGFRFLHWSCSLIQLAVIAVMTFVRAIIRRGLVARPQTLSVRSDEHNTDALTKHLLKDSRCFGRQTSTLAEQDDTQGIKDKLHWNITYAYHGKEIGIHEGHGHPQHKSLAIRSRIRALAQPEDPISPYAKAVTVAIKLVLERLLPDSPSFVWIIDLPGCEDLSTYKIAFKHIDGIWQCEGLVATLESILSLWLDSIKRSSMSEEKARSEHRSKQQDKWFMLGPEDGICLRHNICWWIGSDDGVARTSPPEGSGARMSLGFRGVRNYSWSKVSDAPSKTSILSLASPSTAGPPLESASTNNLPLDNQSKDDPPSNNPSNSLPLGSSPFSETMPTLGIPSVAKTEQFIAQHIFAGFMWAASKFISSSTFSDCNTDLLPGFECDDTSTWKLAKTTSKALSELVENIYSSAHELGSKIEVFYLLIPSLSSQELLPYYSFTRAVLVRSLGPGKLETFFYMRISFFDLFLKFCLEGQSDRFIYSSVAIFDDAMANSWVKSEDPKSPVNPAEQYSIKWMARGCKQFKMYYEGHEKLRFLDGLVGDIDFFYKWQGRPAEIEDPPYDLQGSLNEEKECLNNLRDRFGYNDWHVAIISRRFYQPATETVFDPPPRRGLSYISAPDILGWTPLHYAVVHANYSAASILMQTMYDSNGDLPRDHAGRTPLHYIHHIKGGEETYFSEDMEDMVSVLFDINKSGLQDRLNMNPLHWAARSGNVSAVYLLIDIRNINIDKYGHKDKKGRTAFHWAALSGSVQMLEVIDRLEFGDMAEDELGCTAYDLAVMQKNDKAAQWLLERYPEFKGMGRAQERRSQELGEKQ